jgi:hypothetical protein
VARAKDIAKIGFISTAEAEWILEVGTYPFFFVMGNQSDLIMDYHYLFLILYKV